MSLRKLNEIKKLITITESNSKLGFTANYSLPPLITCIDNAPCEKRCYARKLYQRRRKTLGIVWEKNLRTYHNNSELFFQSISKWIEIKQPRFFRFHVGGDIPNQDYLNGMKQLAKQHKRTKFLTYTKRYELDFRRLPSNLIIIFSMWPNWNVTPPIATMPKSWLNTDLRKPKKAFNCTKAKMCDECRYCWNIKKNQAVVLELR